MGESAWPNLTDPKDKRMLSKGFKGYLMPVQNASKSRWDKAGALDDTLSKR